METDTPTSSDHRLQEAMHTMKRKKFKALPPVPRLPLEVEELFDGHTYSEFPPILQLHSWTKSVPFKVRGYTSSYFNLVNWPEHRVITYFISRTSTRNELRSRTLEATTPRSRPSSRFISSATSPRGPKTGSPKSRISRIASGPLHQHSRRNNRMDLWPPSPSWPFT